MIFGAHVSIASGLAEAVQYASECGCECMQIFAKSPRQWVGRPLQAADVAAFHDARAALGMGPVFTHTAYLINLSTTDEVLRDRSIRALADELERGKQLKAAGVITHIGTDPTGEPEAAAARAADSIARAFAMTDIAEDSDTWLLLENTAGSGTTFGGRMTDICDIVRRSGEGGLPVGICVDTCHAHAFGYDVQTSEGWEELVGEIGESCDVASLKAMHANDCVAPRGEHRDRHAWIGEGMIGEAGFSAMVACRAIDHVCAMTEMPGEVPEKDIVNVVRLKVLRQTRG